MAAQAFEGSPTIPIQQGVAGPPLRGDDGSVYLFRIIATDPSRGLILIRGAVPGSKGGWVLVTDAVKQPPAENAPYPAGLKSDAATTGSIAEQASEVTEEAMAAAEQAAKEAQAGAAKAAEGAPSEGGGDGD